MRAFNKKRKPKHTTKPKFFYDEKTYYDEKNYYNTSKIAKWRLYSLNVFTVSLIANNPFFRDMYSQGVYKFGKLTKSRVCSR